MPVVDLFFDTETTGLTDFKAPYDAPQQPDLLQLGMQVYVDRYPVFEYAPLVMPEHDFQIHPKALEAHGISKEVVKTYGVPARQVLQTFMLWGLRADRIIGHNIKFDWMVLCTALHRHEREQPQSITPHQFCTMQSTTNICCIEGPYGWKWPKLIEAYRTLVDPKGFEGAHNALVDVNACAKIFYALEDKGLTLRGPK